MAQSPLRSPLRPAIRSALRSPLDYNYGGGGFNPASLYSAGQQGAFYDPSDNAVNFQDSGRTTPVIAVANPIGSLGDKSGNGNHAYQATSGARPLLNDISSTLGFGAATGKRLKYDFVDDALLWPGPTGTYYIAVQLLSGVQFYSVKLTNAGAIPINEHFGMFIRSTAFTAPESAQITAYLAAKVSGIAASQMLWEVRYTSYTGRGGNAGAGTPAWLFGSGASYSTMFSSVQATTNREALSFSTNNPSALSDFACNANQLTGSIPSLSANTVLSTFYCNANRLTGSIPSLSTNTVLTTFACHSNQLTGSIPSLSTNTALTVFYCNNNQLTGSIPSLSTNTVLSTFYCHSNQLTGYVGGGVSATLTGFNAQSNQLTTAAINLLLADFAAAGASSGVLALNGSGNAAPTGQGLTDKATLISRGWTVATN